jgi:uncharacterized RDD family membrane protein YckC
MMIRRLTAPLLLLALLLAATAHAQPEAPPAPVGQAPTTTDAPSPTTEPEPKSAVRIGQSLTQAEGQTLRDVVVVMGDARIDGTVTDQVVVILGNLDLGPTAHVGKEVVVVGGEARVAPGARIDGDLSVVLGHSAVPLEAMVAGETVVIGTAALSTAFQAFVPWLTRGLLLGRPLVPDITWVWMVFAAFVLVQFLVHLLAHDTVTAVTATAVGRPLTSVFAGLAVLMAWGPVSVLLAITVVGLLVIPFAGLALLAGGLVGRVAVARAIGFGVWASDEPSSRGAALRSFIVGTAVIAVAYMIPIVGLTAYALISVAAVGAATLTIVDQWRREQPTRVTPEPPPLPDGAPVAQSLTMPSVSPMPPSPPAAPIAEGPEGAAMPPVPPIRPVPEPAASLPPPAGAAPSDSPAALLRYRRASLLERGAALLIDLVLLAVVASSFDWLLPPVLDDSLLGLLIYFAGFWWWKATTPGGMVMGLRVARLNGEHLSLLDAGLRSLVGVVAFIPLGAGVLWILREPERQAWHDLALGTVVVRVPKDVRL